MANRGHIGGSIQIDTAQFEETLKRMKTELVSLDTIMKNIGKVSNGTIAVDTTKTETGFNKVQVIMNDTIAKLDAYNNKIKETNRLQTEMLNSVVSAERAINRVSSSRGSINDEAKMKRMELQAARIMDLQSRIDSLQSRTANRNIKSGSVSYVDAMNMSESTIASRTQKIKALKVARDNLNLSEENAAQKVRQLNIEMRRLNELNQKVTTSGVETKKSVEDIGKYAERMAVRMAMFFSVDMIVGYARRLAEVRGEFELQQKSLAAILQNKYEADKLFGQIVDLAVQSPFKLKDLVSYTKQLAAYRIETENLFDTTKMLADVSAGLGVDMNRLILAYGQVRSAAVLRGQEMRQFTEAGIPLIQALADKFTELEGRVVSTGEVFEKVSQRAVSFRMVDEIFKDMTKSGGVFYKMQELQAETIKGQMTNLADAIDIMYNKIGIQNEDSIKSALATARSLVENFEDVAFYIKAAALAFGAYKFGVIAANTACKNLSVNVLGLNKYIMLQDVTVSSLTTKMKMQVAVAQLLKGTILTLKTAFATMLPIAIAGGFLYLARKMYDVNREAKELTKALNGIKSSGVNEADNLANRFKVLANNVIDSNQSISKQNEKLTELKNVYKDYIPTQNITIESLKAMKGNYDSVTKAIYDKIKAQKLEAGTQAIDERYTKEVSKRQDRIISEFKSKSKQDIDATRLRQAINEVSDELLKGTIKVEDFANKVANVYEEATGQNIRYWDESKASISGTQLQLRLFSKILIDQKSEIENFAKSMDTTFDKFSLYTKDVDLLKKSISDMRTQMDLERQKQIASGDLDPVSAFQFDLQKANAEYAKMQDWFKSKSGGIDFEEYLSLPIDGVDVYLQNIAKSFKKQKESLFGNDGVAGLTSVISNVVNLMQGNMDDFSHILKNNEETVDEWTERVFNSYDIIMDQMALFKKYANDPTMLLAHGLLGFDEEKAQKIIAIYDAIMQRLKLSRDEKDKGGSSKDIELENLKEQLALIEKIQKTYKELIKAGSTLDSAKAEIGKIYKDQIDAISKTKGIDIAKMLSFDNKVMQGVVGDLLKGVKSEAAVKLGKEKIAEFKVGFIVDESEEQVSNIRKSIEKIMNDYKNTSDMTSVVGGVSFLELMGLTPKTRDEAIKELQDMSDSIAEKLNLKALSPDAIKQLEKESDLYKLYLETNTKIQEESLTKLKDNARIYADLFNKYASFEDKKKNLIEKGAELERELANETNEINKQRLKWQLEDNKEQIRNLEFEALKLTEFWMKLYGDLGNLSFGSIDKLGKKLEEAINSAKEVTGDDGNVIAMSIEVDGKPYRVSLEEFTSLVKKIPELADILRAKNPFKALIRDLKSFNEAVEDSAKQSSFVNLTKSVSATAGEANKILSGVTDLLHTIGIESPEMEAVFGGISEMLSGLESIDITKPFSIITGSLKIIGGLFTSIFAPSQARIDKKIAESESAVRKLQYAYEELDRAVERVFGEQRYELNAKLIDNLRKQQIQLAKQADLERDKKKTDKDKLADLENQYKEVGNRIEDIINGIADDLVGTVEDVATQLADAMFDAFKAGEDAAQAWGDTVNDIITDIVRKMLTQKFLADPISKVIDKYTSQWISSDGKIDINKVINQSESFGNELNDIGSFFQDMLEQAMAGSDYLKDLLMGTGGAAELSGLQKGIQGVTEQTAEALESLLNSMRFEQSEHTKLMTDLLKNSNIQTDIASRTLTEVSGIHSLVKEIRSWQSSITASGHKNGGSALKVFIN